MEALEQAKEPTLPELLYRYLALRQEERTGWTAKRQLKGSVSDFNRIEMALDFLQSREIATVESLDCHLDGISEKAVSIRGGMKKAEKRIRAIDTMLSCIDSYEKNKPVYAEYAAIGWKRKKEKYAENHREELDAYNAAMRYLKANLKGNHVNRNGMCICPFHNDKNPSMKVDRRFHCFGCQEDGDVIDFVSRLCGIGSREAALMLASDFSIPYEDRKSTKKQPIRPRLRRETEEQKFKRLERHCFLVLSDYYHLLRRWKEEYAPKELDEAWHPRFVEAQQNMGRLEYLLDTILFGELPERASLIIDYGKEVKKLERRMAELAAGDAAGSKEHSRERTAAPER